MKAPDMPKASIPDQPFLLTIAQVAERLSISTKSVRRLAASGMLRIHRIGGTVRVSKEDLQIYLAGQRR
jgi:excisionase family DNA binding protein